MKRLFYALLYSFLLLHELSFGQAVDEFTSDSALFHASYSLYVADAVTGEAILDINSDKNLTPASVLKLVTSAAALEILGPDYTFTTSLAYNGTIGKRGKLNGNIVIKGGGDPAFASPAFPVFYTGFPDKWIDAIRNLKIRKITGRVLTDDSYYDYLPIPAKWLWEDAGNYYGAGVYGASVYDNTYEIHFRTSSPGSVPIITGIVPEECSYGLVNRLVASGTTDNGYVFAAPYSKEGWLAGSIPVNSDDFILSAAIPDPPLLMAQLVDKRLRSAGIRVGNDPSTTRLLNKNSTILTTIEEYVSPPLSSIIEVLNHKSVNLYAEHLVKEMGKKVIGDGSTVSGMEVISSFADTTGASGMVLVDGSGLSRANAVNAKALATVLIYMRNKGRYFTHYLNSLPDAGQEGTLKNFFRDDVFSGHLKAKSGSMSGVRSYAGYFTARSGREMVFVFITNDFGGPSGTIAGHYEQILKEIILSH